METSSKWGPPNVTVSCGELSCPAGLGALFFPYHRSDGRIELTECAGTQLSSHAVVTDVHCLEEVEATEGWFFEIGHRPVAINKVSLRARMTGPNAIQGFDGDIAILELAQTLPETTLRLARWSDPLPKGLIGYRLMLENGPPPSFAFHSRSLRLQIAEDSTKPYRFSFKRQACSQIDEFPIPLSQHPLNYEMSDCRAKEGNSGSAYVAADDPTRLEALLVSSNRTSGNLVWSNLRCLEQTASGYELGSCIAKSRDVLRARQILSREESLSAAARAHFSSLPLDPAIRYDLRNFSLDALHSLTMYFPVCFTQPVRASSMTMLLAVSSFRLGADSSVNAVLENDQRWSLQTQVYPKLGTVMKIHFETSSLPPELAKIQDKNVLLPPCSVN